MNLHLTQVAMEQEHLYLKERGIAMTNTWGNGRVNDNTP